MLNTDVFPSLQRRGGCAIKKIMPKATKVGADGVVSPRNVFGIVWKHLIPNDHSVCAFKVSQPPQHFLDGAATPPGRG